MKIRIAIAGYGNLGRGVECAVTRNEDMELVGVFTRRAPGSLKTVTGAPVYHMDQVPAMAQDIDVLVLCGGSANDLPTQTPELAQYCNVVDSFDTHAKIPEHFAAVDAAAKKSGKLAVISTGWDPGLFSLNRLYAQAVLPNGRDYTFWGKGVSQGHSDAIRRVPGVKDARQYTIPVEAAMEAVRSGAQPELTNPAEAHQRVLCGGGRGGGPVRHRAGHQDHAQLLRRVRHHRPLHLPGGAGPGSQGHPPRRRGAAQRRHGPQGENHHVIEYKLTLDSNPEFTGSVLTAYARAVARLAKEGQTGCKTVFDIAPAYLHPMSPEEQRSHLL